ncbi:MAG: ATP-binding protein [Actinobacteria bacterium]|nr:ATP-binding protein [Actinomycetota bacterium]
MSFAMTQGVTLLGIDGELVSIEADVSKGLPSYQLLGLPDAALNESRDRIRSAIQNSKLNWPQHKITVSLSPAWLPKSGSGFDLPISIAILAASGQIPLTALNGIILIGELSLEGALKPIRGILPMLLAAAKHGCKQVILPKQNAAEASLIEDIEVLPAENLSQVIGFLNGRIQLSSVPFRENTEPTFNLDFSQVAGQQRAKFGMEVAATGGQILDSLRQPLESGVVEITRAIGSFKFPAQFMLVLAANPCPCGRFSGKGRGCQCTSLQVRRYLSKLSGPLLDRVDLRVKVDTPTRAELADTTPIEGSAQVRGRVEKARQIAQERFTDYNFALNSQIPSELLRTRFKARQKAMISLHNLIDREEITARGFHKLLRLCWSIADLRDLDVPGIEELETAMSLRSATELAA